MSIKQVKEIDKRIHELEREMGNLIHQKSLILEKIKEEKGSSFRQGKKFFQIRLRDHEYYLASSAVAFGSWLKKNGHKLSENHS